MNVDLWVPGPWWHCLTYSAPDQACMGSRVEVQLGRRKAVGIVRAVNVPPVPKMKEAVLIDEKPILSESQMVAIDRISRHFFVSASEVARFQLPEAFWKLESFVPTRERRDTTQSTMLCYIEPDDQERYERIAGWIGEHQGGLVMTAEAYQVATLAQFLRQRFGDRVHLWPNTGGAKVYQCWNALANLENPIVVSGPAGALVPMKNPDFLIVDDQFNGGYETQKGPLINRWMLARERFETAGAKILITGRCPSSSLAPEAQGCRQKPLAKISFLNTYQVQQQNLRGFEFSFPLAKPLLQQTTQVVNQGKVAMWLLDRKSYAGSHRCVQCGHLVTCPNCDNRLYAQGQSLRCGRCGWSGELQHSCPCCGSQIMQFRTPGLEAFEALAKTIAGEDRVAFWYQGEPSSRKKEEELIQKFKKNGGLILASRRGLELLSRLSVELVGWLDGDSEARIEDYGGTAQAFSMVWESLCRGEAKSRTVFFQTRQPLRGWQKGLTQGWKVFWSGELNDRSTLDFPPYCWMITVYWTKKGREQDLVDVLQARGFEVLEDDQSFTVMTDNVSQLWQALEPRYSIGNSGKGYPVISLRCE